MSDTQEIKAVDCNGKELKVGDTVIVKSVDGNQSIADRFRVGDLVTVTGFGPVPYEDWLSAVEVTVEGMSTGQFAYRYEFYSRPTCCNLQEAADLLEGASVLFDHAALERAINPRPQTLPAHKIRIVGCCAPYYLLVNTDDGVFQVISGRNHNRLDDKRLTNIGYLYAIELDALEEHGYTLLDTWSHDTEFPELLES